MHCACSTAFYKLYIKKHIFDLTLANSWVYSTCSTAYSWVYSACSTAFYDFYIKKHKFALTLANSWVYSTFSTASYEFYIKK